MLGVDDDAIFVETAIAIATSIGVGEQGLLKKRQVRYLTPPIDWLYL